MSGLHRKKPLVRKTPPASHAEGLKRKTPLVRVVQLRASAPLPAMSEKRRQAMVTRRSFVKAFLTAHPRCQVRWNGGCTGWAVHVHEKLTRARGGSIVDPENCVAVCWFCHAMVHAYPAEATERGWLRSAGH